MFDILFTYIETFLPLPEFNRQRCRTYFKPVRFPRSAVIQPSGQVPEFHNFVVSGILRNSVLDERGQEITLDLSDGPRFFTTYEHFMARTVSPERITSLTDCELLRVSRADVEIMMADEDTVIRDFSMMVMQQAWEGEKQRLEDRRSLTAAQRYQKFMLEHPRLLQQVPLQYIASYLGLQPESLSRIRRNMSS
jgi:CRP-like cAMP-binding protein